jgi:hypothetical protein
MMGEISHRLVETGLLAQEPKNAFAGKFDNSGVR